MKLSSLSALLAVSALTLSLTACGGTPASHRFDPATLEGSWSLFGPLPGSAFGTVPVGGNALAVTIDVIGNQVIASSSIQLACGAFTTALPGNVLLGTLAGDGTFTLSEQTIPGTPQQTSTLQITGKLASVPGGGWSGTYTYTPDSTSCQPLSGSFVATPIQPVGGTYTGSTTARPLPDTGPPMPVTIAATLTQGATTPGTGTGSSFYKASAITGTVTVSGVSCFSSGTSSNVNSLPFSALEGNYVELNFTMDDGSTLTLSGYEEDLAASKLNILLASDSNGKCEFASAARFELAK